MVEDDGGFQRQLVFSPPLFSPGAGLGRSRDAAPQNELVQQWRLRIMDQEQPSAELFDSLIHHYASRDIHGVRERPPRAGSGTETHSLGTHAREGPGQGTGSNPQQDSMVWRHESNEQNEPIRAFARRSSMSSLSPSFSPWSAYLPSYSPTSPNYSPIYVPSASMAAQENTTTDAPTSPGYNPTRHLHSLYAPTPPSWSPTPHTRSVPTAPRYVPSSPTYAPSTAAAAAADTSTLRPSEIAGEYRAQPPSRSTIDYFRLLSRASNTQHRRRMREDRDRVHSSAVARAGAEYSRAAQRSRSREGGSACTSGPCAGIAPCSFLRPGMTFEGVQSSQEDMPSPAKEWSVAVEITQVSLDTGVLSGTMTARNIPRQPGSVVTYFTGEVIDMSSYNFMSPEHDTDEGMDWNHWNQFSAFCAISRGRLSALGDLTLQEVDSTGCVFMRWKERVFVSKLRACHGSLTITGFYYVCLERATGKILGSYCDPVKAMQGEWTHFAQKLLLNPSCQKSSGYSFGTVSFS